MRRYGTGGIIMALVALLWHWCNNDATSNAQITSKNERKLAKIGKNKSNDGTGATTTAPVPQPQWLHQCGGLSVKCIIYLSRYIRYMKDDLKSGL